MDEGEAYGEFVLTSGRRVLTPGDVEGVLTSHGCPYTTANSQFLLVYSLAARYKINCFQIKLMRMVVCLSLDCSQSIRIVITIILLYLEIMMSLPDDTNQFHRIFSILCHISVIRY